MQSVWPRTQQWLPTNLQLFWRNEVSATTLLSPRWFSSVLRRLKPSRGNTSLLYCGGGDGGGRGIERESNGVIATFITHLAQCCIVPFAMFVENMPERICGTRNFLWHLPKRDARRPLHFYWATAKMLRICRICRCCWVFCKYLH